MKISMLDGRPVNFVPEFEDCRRLAVEKGSGPEGSAGCGHSCLPCRERLRASSKDLGKLLEWSENEEMSEELLILKSALKILPKCRCA